MNKKENDNEWKTELDEEKESVTITFIRDRAKCPCCGKETSKSDGYVEREVVAFPMKMGDKVVPVTRIKVRKFKCKNCGKGFSDDINGYLNPGKVKLTNQVMDFVCTLSTIMGPRLYIPIIQKVLGAEEKSALPDHLSLYIKNHKQNESLMFTSNGKWVNVYSKNFTPINNMPRRKRDSEEDYSVFVDRYSKLLADYFFSDSCLDILIEYMDDESKEKYRRSMYKTIINIAIKASKECIEDSPNKDRERIKYVRK